jgi:hypothetical protein
VGDLEEKACQTSSAPSNSADTVCGNGGVGGVQGVVQKGKSSRMFALGMT